MSCMRKQYYDSVSCTADQYVTVVRWATNLTGSMFEKEGFRVRVEPLKNNWPPVGQMLGHTFDYTCQKDLDKAVGKVITNAKENGKKTTVYNISMAQFDIGNGKHKTRICGYFS